MFELRDYQVTARNQILQWISEGDSSVVNTLVSVMASGKTVCVCSSINELITQGLKVWVLVNRIELLTQWRDEFYIVNPEMPRSTNGFIAANKPHQHSRPLQLVQVQTLGRRLAGIKPEHLPDVIFLDEAHETGFFRVLDKLKRLEPSIKQINVTATPTVAGNRQQQYIDKYPLWEFPGKKNKLKGTGKQYWYQAATARQMIDMGRWKKPNWIIASDALSALTAGRFSGVNITSGGEYDDTSQAAVMIDLLPHHIQEWQDNGGLTHHTVWFCVNVAHCIATLKALKLLGRNAVMITGDTDPKDRKNYIAAFKRGEVTDLVNCQCLTTGFDAPIASCAVWLRRTMSVGLFAQMAGRVLRYCEGSHEGLLMDFAGNLALHPFPEQIDWWTFNPSKKMFRDPSMVVCKHCSHRHEGIPKPLHPLNSKIKFNVGMGDFHYPEDYTGDKPKVTLQDTLRCHECGSDVFYDPTYLSAYSSWLTEVKHAAMCSEKPPKYLHDTAGVSIGVQDAYHDPLTIEDMYTLEVWSLVDSDGESNFVPMKDRSEDWNKLREKQLNNVKGKALLDLRFRLLSESQQKFIVKYPMTEILKIEDMNDKYRASLIYGYIGNLSPVKSFAQWDGLGPPPKDQVKLALYNIAVKDNAREENFKLLHDWLVHHLEATTDQKRKGVCRQFLKCLEEVRLGWVPGRELTLVQNTYSKVTLAA